MARIYIFGENNPIIVPYEKAVQIQKFIEDKAIPKDERVKIGESFSGVKADIRRIWLDKEEYKAKIKKDDGDSMDEYLKHRKKVQSMTMLERSKLTGFFTLVFFSYMNRKPNEQEIEMAEKLQLMFYEDNPFRIVPDPIIFSEDLIPNTARPGFGISYVRPALSLDTRYAENEESYAKSFKK